MSDFDLAIVGGGIDGIAIDAAARGASNRTRARCIGASREAGQWRLAIDARGKRETIVACALSDAAGPWVAPASEEILQLHLDADAQRALAQFMVNQESGRVAV
jgi:glycerol-3-phosphate dehydrogenase